MLLDHLRTLLLQFNFKEPPARWLESPTAASWCWWKAGLPMPGPPPNRPRAAPSGRRAGRGRRAALHLQPHGRGWHILPRKARAPVGRSAIAVMFVVQLSTNTLHRTGGRRSGGDVHFRWWRRQRWNELIDAVALEKTTSEGQARPTRRSRSQRLRATHLQVPAIHGGERPSRPPGNARARRDPHGAVVPWAEGVALGVAEMDAATGSSSTWPRPCRRRRTPIFRRSSPACVTPGALRERRAADENQPLPGPSASTTAEHLRVLGELAYPPAAWPPDGWGWRGCTCRVCPRGSDPSRHDGCGAGRLHQAQREVRCGVSTSGVGVSVTLR